MSMGIVTGAIVIFRAFFQLKKTDNNYRASPTFPHPKTPSSQKN
jgi:hypothetical protein